MRPQLGRLLVPPLITIGVLAAILVWEIENVGSVTIALLIAAVTVGLACVVVARVRRQIDELSDHYEALLRTADEESRRAEAANRVKDEFLTTLSHELRTPLHSVLGWARLLASGKLDKEQSLKAVRAIERAGWAQTRLIEDLLDISRVVSGKLQISTRPTFVQRVVEQTVVAIQPAADAKNIRLETELEPLTPIAADPDRLQQIVWNLLSNAIKFTPVGGSVAVRVTRDLEHVRITVADTGVGFAPETAAHLFERFRQGDSSTTRAFGGLGLGLGIVRHLAELHGGTVTAHSAGPDRGSRFEVRLPIGRPILAGEEQAEQPADPSTLDGIVVLVVDDDPLDLDYVRSSLEHYGAFVLTASSAREARDCLSRHHPDVLVSDLKMPDESGFELIRQVREMDRAQGRITPAAAVTALTRSEDRRDALAAGYQRHIAKPADPADLAAVIKELAAGREWSGRPAPGPDGDTAFAKPSTS